MELFVINAVISLFEVHLYLVYLNIVLPALHERLFNCKQLICGRSSCSEASLMFSVYDSNLRCVMLVSIIKQFLCSSHSSVYHSSFGWDKLNFSSIHQVFAPATK